MEATGNTLFGKVLPSVLLFSLAVASISNVYVLFFPQDQSRLYFYLDLFWPASNLLMFITGITVALAGKLPGWKRFVPLVVGSWFPILVLCMALLGRSPETGTILGLYSAIAWSVLAVMIMETREDFVLLNRPKPIYTAENRMQYH